MSLQTVPLLVAPAQSFSVVLSDLDVGITLRTLQGALYADVVCNGTPICVGQRCLDRVPITPRAAYLGYPDLSLVFADLRGTSDPQWSEFGSRYVLLNAVAAPAADTAVFRTPILPLLADGTYFADGSQFANGIVTL